MGYFFFIFFPEQVTPVGGWASEPVVSSVGEGAGVNSIANEESVNELDEAEKQLAQDLAELQALMAEHSDIPGAGPEMPLSTAEDDSSATGAGVSEANLTARAEASPKGTGNVKGSMMGGDNDSDEDELSPSSDSMSEATFESEIDDDDDVFFG